MDKLKDEHIGIEENQIGDLIDKVHTTLQDIENLNQKRLQSRRFLNDDKELMKKHRDFIGIGIVLEEHKNNDENAITFISELKKRSDEIRPFNPNLAEMIDKAEATVETDVEGTKVLFQLHKILKMPSMEKVTAELSQNPRYYLDNIKDEKFGRELRYLFSTILGVESNELRKYLNNLTQLRSNLRGYIKDLELDLEVRYKIKDNALIKKLDKFEKNLPPNLDNEIRFLGESIINFRNWIIDSSKFHSYLSELHTIVNQLLSLKDKDFVRLIRDTNITKRFLFFELEYYYFADVDYHDKQGEQRLGLLRKVGKGEAERGWEDFLKVVKNVKKEAKYVKDEFGDIEVAQRLIDIEAQHHDSPEEWKVELKKLLIEIGSGERRSKILENARNALITLFDTRRRELLQTLQNKEKKLVNIIEDRIKDLDSRKEKAVKEMRNLVDKKIKETYGKSVSEMKKIFGKAKAIELSKTKDLGKIREEMEKKEIEVLRNTVNFVSDSQKAYDIENNEKKAREMAESLNKSNAWERYNIEAVKKAGQMKPNQGVAIIANNVMRGLKIIQNLDERFMEINEEAVANSTKLIGVFQELTARGDSIKVDMKNLIQNFDGITKEHSIEQKKEEKENIAA